MLLDDAQRPQHAGDRVNVAAQTAVVKKNTIRQAAWDLRKALTSDCNRGANTFGVRLIGDSLLTNVSGTTQKPEAMRLFSQSQFAGFMLSKMEKVELTGHFTIFIAQVWRRTLLRPPGPLTLPARV
ncbi:MAG: hypothetical protein KatS3mg110_1834 [Pirellulaceae bacterium]|nr:MAG: hypothetical protein KatS3mg110_1834 [Pirellulaceae bacterium]